MTHPQLGDPRELRPALYHRFHRVLPFVAHPVARMAWRGLAWSLVAAYFVFAGAILLLRYSVLPDIERYRPDIEQIASRELGLPVRIGGITAGWDGLKPDLVLSDVRIDGRDGRAALAFSRIEAVLDWSSLAFRQLRLALLAIDEPVLHIRRNAAGELSVAGIPVSEGGGDTNAADWVLGQKRIRINGATLVWEDEKRGAPPLVLEDLNFALDNDGDRHRFGITAIPPPDLAARIDLRGDLEGDDLATLSRWQGRIFSELDYVDLAGFQRWVDYPFALPRGRGAMRTWLSISEGRLLDITSDLALEDVRLQLSRALPELRLVSLSGRVFGRLRPEGVAAGARELSLTLADGTQVPPTDFSFDWQSADEHGKVRGSGTASRMNLQRLSGLARYLPVDAATRKLLDDFAPSGEIFDLRLSFAGDAERLQSYSLRARFESLGLRANGYFPGFFGISGNVDATEKGGSVVLRSQASGLDLPSVFPEPRLTFDSLAAQARWKVEGEQVDVELQRIDFAGSDAAGSARGDYHYRGDGPGSIDLTASLSRAAGTSVWRYMPHAVNVDARDWLRQGITHGHATDAKLVLKGDLARFPFVDGSGTFLVTAKAHDVTVDYAPGWPKIEGIEADLRFAGAGMRVDARRGSMFGARIGTTVAEIDDFDAEFPNLSVRGRVDGPTGEFFRFIENSPVGEMLEHPTAEMKATGNGQLDLSLHIPLGNIDATRVQGDYRFVDNRIVIDPLLPPLASVGGVLRFTDDAISIREINAQFLGGPVKVRAGTRNGVVEVLASGSLSMAQAQRHYELPVFDRLSGSAKWRADVMVRKGSADVVVESDLTGVSSSLPAPFNKPATDTMPIRFEKGAPPVSGGKRGDSRDPSIDRIRLLVGTASSSVAAAELHRRRNAAGVLTVDRGALAIGVPLSLPDKGLAAAVAVQAFDLDFWQSALTPTSRNGAQPAAAPPMLPDAVSLKTPLLDVFGRRFHDADLKVRRQGGVWQAAVASREASGDVQYDTFGRGAVRARLKVLAPPMTPRTAAGGHDADTGIQHELPALDVVADQFVLGDLQLGRLEVQAHHVADNWRIDKVSIVNQDGRFEGSGVWRSAAPRRFDMDFRLDTDNAGALLDRMGYPGTLRRGTAAIAGQLQWAGVPFSLDYPSLTGRIRVDAAKGQFAKMDPGAAGKLLGLISLQGLPRRITLDFQDVFSEGFAFDSIAGRIDVKAGVMHTERLQIDGPAARVVMRGDVNLQNETQRLFVNVQPELGGTAALGVALINPIAGAATLLAHKVLQNPLNHVFSFDYGISGTWDDPKVEKLSGQRLGTVPEGDGGKRESTK